ncbi:hypothetical protein M413DRAFT_31910 [Hebeloma cylindrosporum]|uniref:Uncharacterized protein n=1 Tax=Hebeloma cylindrosporum TaxID=76867 RepID=A0A0C3BXL1_HEBCY|nr:hypothetical protein M413DRAFT_31910 [Hebeloma cylindrosporum h7]
MHAIANSPITPSYPSSGRGNEILAAGIASLFLSPPTYSSLDSPSSTAIERSYRSVPQFPWVDVRPPLSNGNPAPGLDVVQSTHLHCVNRTRGGFDVTQLPVEIICEIFEKFMEDDLLHPVRDDTSVTLVSHTCRSDPTKLGQICSRWRAVAINLPKLWSNILIYNPKISQAHLTGIWLERSGNNPLNLEINYDTGKRSYDIGAAARILESFIAHLGRWKRFRFNLSTKLLGLLYAVVDSPHKPLILESVDLHFHDLLHYNHAEVHIDAIDAIWNYFHGFPTLRQVVWHGHEVNSFPKHAPFQLTHVHVRFSISVNDIMSFLPQISLIQELQIESLRRPSKDTSGTISLPLLLQHLRLLRIRSHGVPATSFIASLTCPLLESLAIIHSNLPAQSNQDLQEIPRLLHRSGCHLQKLNLTDTGLNITDGELTRCLSDSPLRSLTSLFLCAKNISNQMAGLLSRKSPDGSHEFAPFLGKLDLLSCETADGLLASMVSSRWHEPLDDNRSTPLGYLREAGIFPKKDFGPIDEAFFSANFPY